MAWGWEETSHSVTAGDICLGASTAPDPVTTVYIQGCAVNEGSPITAIVEITDFWAEISYDGYEHWVSIGGGTATPYDDYTPFEGTVVGTGMYGLATVTTPTMVDGLSEGPETVVACAGPCIEIPIFETWPQLTATSQAATEGNNVVVTISSPTWNLDFTWNVVSSYTAEWGTDFSGSWSGSGTAGPGSPVTLVFPTTNDAVVETTESFGVNVCLGDDCRIIEARIVDNDVRSVGFEADVQSTTEGNHIGLTITTSAYLPIMWWTADKSPVASASSATDYLGASGGGMFAGQQGFQIFTLASDHWFPVIPGLQVSLRSRSPSNTTVMITTCRPPLKFSR